MLPDPIEILRRTDFFSGISEKNLKALAEISITKKVERRQLLFLEGQEGHCMYILAEGTVQLFKTAPDGREVVIKTVQPGEIFAEVILFEQKSFPVSARALENSLVLMLSRLQIDCLLANEAFRRDFIAMLMRKQRYLTERILYLSAHDVEDRFFCFLREQYGLKKEYRLSLSKKDLAAAIGTIPETLSRLILRLKKEGKIQWEGNTLIIKT